MKTATFTHFHFCGGLGGAALGLGRARAEVGGFTGQALCLGGIDSDPAACRDFRRNVGVEQACMDLFDRGMYADFYGHEPPPDWQEVTVADVQRAAQGQAPDIVVISAPCKGYSRLTSREKALTPKYRALNKLVLRCIHLALTAWEDDPPSLFLIENVTGIVAALQGFDWQDGTGALVLDGVNRAKWQERIGNAIPPPSAEAIGREMLRTLLLSRLGQTFALSSTDVWVRQVALALTVDGREVEV